MSTATACESGPGDERFTRSTDVLSREMLGDEVLLLHTDGVEVVRLGGTGVHLWSELAEPRTVAEIVERCARSYGAEPSEIEADVSLAIEMLRAARLVEVIRSP